uniref:Transposase n=1 Tax=Ditylenchus dipsaci TaxID=166011 RepID=A0A915DBK3_9BILA
MRRYAKRVDRRARRVGQYCRTRRGFDLEQAHNPQNDRIWSKDPLPLEERIVSRSQKPKQVMVWAGVTHNGKTPLIFVPEGVKVRGPGYRSMLKRSAAMDTGTFGEVQWTFQQDGAPSHRAEATFRMQSKST